MKPRRSKVSDKLARRMVDRIYNRTNYRKMDYFPFSEPSARYWYSFQQVIVEENIWQQLTRENNGHRRPALPGVHEAMREGGQVFTTSYEGRKELANDNNTDEV